MAIPVPEVAAMWMPALSAVLGAIVGSLSSGMFTLVAINKQHKAQTHREFLLIHEKWRGAWRDKLTDTIPDIIETAGWFYVSKYKDKSTEWTAEKTSKTVRLAQLITRVGLMLNSNEQTHIEVMQAMDTVRACAFAEGRQLEEFERATKMLESRCTILLKEEAQRANEVWQRFSQ